MTRLLRLVRLLTYGVAGLLFLLLVATAVERVVWRGKVLPGVQLIGTSVSGKSADSLDDRLAAAADRLEREVVVARAGSKEFRLEPRRIGLEIDAVATVEVLADAGRTGNPLDQVVGTALRMARPDEIMWHVEYDDDAFREVLDEWAAEVEVPSVDGSLEFDGARVVPIEPRAGRELARPAADDALDEALRSGRRDRVTLPVRHQVPRIDAAAVRRAAERARAVLASPVTITIGDVVTRVSPEKLATALQPEPSGSTLRLGIDPDRFREVLGERVTDLEGPPEDARFVVEGTTVDISPHRAGRVIDFDHLERAVVSGARKITGRFTEEDPDTTTADLEKLEVEELVSSFTTHYPAGQPRVKNIQRASEIVNNTIILSDHVFSLNESIGRRTAENGFVVAPVIYAGEYTEDVGGGVSQFATTFFNAVFFGGYPIAEYQAHTFYISRYPMGREATVSFPSPDLRFRNDTDAAILVRTSAGASSVTVNFYSTKVREVSAEGPVVLATQEPEEELVPDGSIERGQRVTREGGSTGQTVRVTRVTRNLDGEEIDRKTFTTRYRAQKRVIALHPCDLPDGHDAKPPEDQCKQEEEEPDEEPKPEDTTTTTKPGAGAP